MDNKIKKVLESMVKFLQEEKTKLSKNFPDGRINSITNEDEILNLLSEEFKIDITKSRAWADFFINNEPVNIKITTTKTADNASSKEGVFYALTGKMNPPNDYEQYFKELKEILQNNSQDENKDYYYLIVNKENNTDIFFNSLKCLEILTPNGNNLPFQINWGKNRNQIKRTHKKSTQFILETFGKSLQKRADADISFEKYFKHFL